MQANRLIAAIFGNVYSSREDTIEKFKFNSRFYAHMDDAEIEGEVIFCKNNVLVFCGKSYVPGYFTLKACSINEDYTRLVLHWTSNLQLKENVTDLKQSERATIIMENNDVEVPHSDSCVDDKLFPDVFHIDLCDMKTLRFFFAEDESSGHFVVGNHENHYKVFRFDLAGMNHLEEIFEHWSLCKTVKLPEEESRKKSFTVIPIYYIQPDQSLEESRYKPMSKARWLLFFNSSGQLEDVANFRKEVFFGGILPEVRHEAWPFMLHYYPFHSRTCERKTIKEQKTKEYLELNEKRLNMPKQDYDKFWLSVQCTVDKDVVRTDRTHPYFSGCDNPNIETMRKILLNFAWYQPAIGYNQGMSDLVASILCTVQDEVDTFWCFVGLMENSVFVTSPKDDSMDCQLLYLKELLRMMAVKFYAHLLLEDEGMDLLFCHRWLLLGFKREFYDLHVMRMWEASWSHYQTEYFHIFLCVAIVVEYGDDVWQKSMRVDEILNYFNKMALQMDGDKVLRKARSLLHQFRQLATIPCTLRGLLSGPGIWDSATLPDVECNCHTDDGCKYMEKQTRKRGLSNANSIPNNEVSSNKGSGDIEGLSNVNNPQNEDVSLSMESSESDNALEMMEQAENVNSDEKQETLSKRYNGNSSMENIATQQEEKTGNLESPEDSECDLDSKYDENHSQKYQQVNHESEEDDAKEFEASSGQEYETCPESPHEITDEMVEDNMETNNDDVESEDDDELYESSTNGNDDVEAEETAEVDGKELSSNESMDERPIELYTSNM